MKCNQKTIGQGTALRVPTHPQASELECPWLCCGRSCPVCPCSSCRCVGTVTAVTARAWAHPDKEMHSTADTNA